MLKVRNENIGSEGVLGVSCTKNEYNAKGVGELLDQCSQSNYNKNTGVKQWVNPNASYHVVNPNYTNVVSLAVSVCITNASSRIYKLPVHS